MNPLAVIGRRGEAIDPRLGDFKPTSRSIMSG
jgi:hypothetical protein